MNQFTISFLDTNKGRLYFKGFSRDSKGSLVPEYSTLVSESTAWEEQSVAKDFLHENMTSGHFYSLDGWPAFEVFHIHFSNCQVCKKEISSAGQYFKEGYCSSLCKLDAISIEESFYGALGDIHSILQQNATRSFLR